MFYKGKSLSSIRFGESLQQRRWYRKLWYFFKLIKSKSPVISSIIFSRLGVHTEQEILTSFLNSTLNIKNSCFPSTEINWKNPGKRIRNSESFHIFQKSILKFIKPSPSNIFNCRKSKGTELLASLRLSLRHLRHHVFKYSFQDSLNPICKCGTDKETAVYYLLHFQKQPPDLFYKKRCSFKILQNSLENTCARVSLFYTSKTSGRLLLHCPNFSHERLILINNIRNINNNILDLNESRFSVVPLSGNCSFNNTKNTFILNTTIEYIVSSKIFDVPFINS